MLLIDISCSILKTFLDAHPDKVEPLFLIHGKMAGGEERLSIVKEEAKAKEDFEQVYYGHIYALFSSL